MKSEPFKSPLRYPGGKANLADYVEGFLRKNLLTGSTFVEPFVGGAGLSLSLIQRDLINNCIWIEKDPLIYSLWNCIFMETENLCRLIDETPVTLETWMRLQSNLEDDALIRYSPLENAVAGLFLNRMNFSGILHTRPIGGMDQISKYKVSCRTNKKSLIKKIERIADLKKRITVKHGDALEYLQKNKSIRTNKDIVIYVDPPYLIQGKRLYRHSFTPDDHLKLAQVMDGITRPWLVSIDNHQLIQEAYRNQKIVPIFLSYVVRKARKAEELIISNINLEQPIYSELNLAPNFAIAQ